MGENEIAPRIYIYILNEGGFKSLDKDGFLSYEKLGINDKLQSFIVKRLRHFGYENHSFISDVSEIRASDCEFSCVINIVNPFIDCELVSKMLAFLKRNSEYDACRCEGAVPGTELDILFRSKSLSGEGVAKLKCLTYNYDSQARYNNQFNLRKLKRVKMFLKLTEVVENVEALTVPELIEKLHDKGIFEKLVSYFEDVRLVYLNKCPCCDAEILPIFSNISQPMIGYVPADMPWHYRCMKCKLIMLSPYVHADYSEKLYDFYSSESQGTAYFLDRGARSKHYAAAIAMVKNVLPEEVRGIDLGCGAGVFIHYAKEHMPSWSIIGCDFSERVDFFKDQNIEVLHLDFLKGDLGVNKYDLVTAWEVVEHIPFKDFKLLLDKVHKALKVGGVFLFSTPDFDSPLCQAFDFFATCAPHHPLVFSKSWMNYYFANNEKFKILKMENESAMLEIYESWFGYWKDTSKHFESKTTAKLLLELLRDTDASEAFHKLIKKKEWGADMIVALQKK